VIVEKIACGLRDASTIPSPETRSFAPITLSGRNNASEAPATKLRLLIVRSLI
jgi:hypothetical protein